MAQIVASPETPIMHLDPYEGAKELRVLLREIKSLTDNGGAADLGGTMQRAADYLDARVASALDYLNGASILLNQMEQEIERLADEAVLRKPSHTRGSATRLKGLLTQVRTGRDNATRYLLNPSYDDDQYHAGGHWQSVSGISRILKATGGGDSVTGYSASLKKKVRRARVIAQGLPTTPFNAVTPAETVVNALVTILTNFKYVKPGDPATMKKQHEDVTLEAIDAAVKFEDTYGMSKEEYIQENGYDPEEDD